MADIKPFKIEVSDETLEDLRKRLELTRYPHELDLPKGEEWSYGTPRKTVQELVEYWKNEYDWRKAENELNTKLPQFTTDINTEEHDTLTVHFAHVRSSRPNAIPLLIVHGWPGNFAEPSNKPGFGLKATAEVFHKLMHRLGYQHYMAQGGDFGGLIVRALAIWYPESCRGIHTTFLVMHPILLLRHPIMVGKLLLGFIGAPGGYTPSEIEGMKPTINFFIKEEGVAYSIIQRQAPQTLGFGMTDSPAGLLAWIREKYEAWPDRYNWTNDEILMWTMLYWIPGPAPSFRYYKESFNTEKGLADLNKTIKAWSDVPLGVSTFKKESIQWPDELGGMVQPLKFARRHETGGHFAAWENPDVLARDIQEFAGIVALEEPAFYFAASTSST
ncbi:hypothetical protein FRC04_006603 [Tulasnella sp. 424]|nr:hypothetical protein FRC04_006603 [Tulasnella sp. 424]KAG8960943.1 hypothetical protein FRC05_006435 [Tulasnella sp. 425]